MKHGRSKWYSTFILITALAAATACAADVTGDRLAIGNSPIITGNSATIAGGQYNTNKSDNAAVGGGTANTISTNSTWSVISGGAANFVRAEYGALGGGNGNRILTTNGLPTGFDQNDSKYGVIAGGSDNLLFSAVSVISGGNGNKIEAFAYHSTISGGGANIIGYSSGYSTISGGSENEITGGAEWAAINGGLGNEIEFTVTSTNDTPEAHGGWIGGGFDNYIKGPQAKLAAIGGGAENLIHGYVSTIGGGHKNVIDGNWGAIPGGQENVIMTNSVSGAIGGGAYNVISNAAEYATIAGGAQNAIGTNSVLSTVGGGQFNRIGKGASWSTIPGGYNNLVETNFAFASGYFAKAAHVGAFVWSDNSAASYFASTNNNEFAARTTGGVRFETGSGTGVKLSPGSGSWASLSDRNAKANFAKVDNREILARVAALPLNTWNYKAQGESIRHIGPVAQDFHAAFGVGDDERTITTIDADGVALAAIQALNDIVKEKDVAIREMLARLKTLESLMLKEQASR